MLIKAENRITKEAKALCRKFINKVETGKARSRETYADCKALLDLILKSEGKDVDKSGG